MPDVPGTEHMSITSGFSSHPMDICHNATALGQILDSTHISNSVPSGLPVHTSPVRMPKWMSRVANDVKEYVIANIKRYKQYPNDLISDFAQRKSFETDSWFSNPVLANAFLGPDLASHVYPPLPTNDTLAAHGAQFCMGHLIKTLRQIISRTNVVTGLDILQENDTGYLTFHGTFVEKVMEVHWKRHWVQHHHMYE